MSWVKLKKMTTGGTIKDQLPKKKRKKSFKLRPTMPHVSLKARIDRAMAKSAKSSLRIVASSFFRDFFFFAAIEPPQFYVLLT
ncbi:MAG: hypothetical protein BSOLF_0959 [Candidatus Carbobacillus altaicus]|uniref:Uncharacterized protein n=1 Tax=Candidatus Carbonibacillus altaicus TaxID=2163959 RepID=A0A2R6Y050_9BACL|nr:MAG: hypothetical protein BSOLF_0959 [Candidatus Carbobacillus altaicus]